ncbi:MAG: sugar phosphate isomerase/epimerase [Planctomycetota bacterium]|nr:sugar phosphate isomerase/epimerase [Planctomycetota bacterium]
MSIDITRRSFLGGSAAGIGLMAARPLMAGPFKTTLRKAVIRKSPTEDELKKIKDAGFQGIEAHTVPVEEAAKARELAEKLGLRIHSVMGGGSPAGLRAAQAYGADAVLHVPGGVGGVAMPEPWEFDIAFDEKTGHLTRVVAGDNARFVPYIEAHNRSMDGARESVKRLIPIAEETKVVVALENVWNNFNVRPELHRWLAASFESPWVKVYFDIGNHIKYAAAMRDGKLQVLYPPEAWVRAFGSLLAKVHVKDYRLNNDLRGGAWARIGDGTTNWLAVRQALDDVGYSGWLTDETGLALPELSRRLDRIIAGQPVE